MNPRILHTAVQDYIRNNEKADIHRLLLQESPFPGLSTKELAEQIESRNKARSKLPTWFSATSIYYPNKRNLEQSSSEQAAAYKASLVDAGKVFDLTGGFGIDTYYFSKKAKEVIYWESDEQLAAIAAHNLKQLGAANVSCQHGDGIAWLKEKKPKADLIYIDPSRRSSERKRVFLLSDCQPDVPGHLPFLFDSASMILVKTSPLLDLNAGLRELHYVKEIHIVAINNEVKEVLWLLERGFKADPIVHTVNLLRGGNQLFSFSLPQEKLIERNFSEPLLFLYEPNAAIMKSGGFNSLGLHYNLPQLHVHSHLFTSDTDVEFPGRAFKVRRVLPFSRKNMKTLACERANITTRNFPISVAEIRKRSGIADGGPLYLFFTKTTGMGLIMIECEKN